jgi:hypothetical protein
MVRADVPQRTQSAAPGIIAFGTIMLTQGAEYGRRVQGRAAGALPCGEFEGRSPSRKRTKHKLAALSERTAGAPAAQIDNAPAAQTDTVLQRGRQRNGRDAGETPAHPGCHCRPDALAFAVPYCQSSEMRASTPYLPEQAHPGLQSRLVCPSRTMKGITAAGRESSVSAPGASESPRTPLNRIRGATRCRNRIGSASTPSWPND